MKLMIEIAVMTSGDAEFGHIHTLPFESVTEKGSGLH